MSKKTGIVGVSDHCGWAVFVTAAAGEMIDRRRVELIGDGLPNLPHHHDCQRMPLQEAIELVERVRVSALRKAIEALEVLVAEVPIEIAGIAIRRCPSLPASIAERITDYRSQNVADSVMYRDALGEAAKARRWQVYWYETKTVFGEAAAALDLASIDRFLRDAGKSAGAPWRKDHRIAFAAAIAASDRRATRKLAD